MQIQNFGAARTMSSIEIADLVESNHADVRRSIERIAERGVITLQPLAEVSNPGPGPKTIKVYQVSQRDSYVIVAQLSPEFTARLVDRWQALEAAAPAPRELSRLEVLQLAIESEHRAIAAEAARDEAIATKHLIGSKREATAMATASSAKREASKLREELGACARHATITAVQNATGSEYSFTPLRRWCKENGATPTDVPDKRYGKVKAWPAAAWAICHDVDLSALFGVEVPA